MTRLILICGLPGAGKSTLARRIVAGRPAVRLCPDEWMEDLRIDLFDEDTRDRLERRFWVHAQELLRLGQTVVLESGFWVRAERDEKRLAARALGTGVELHYLTAPVDELARRIAARAAAGEPGAVPISRELLDTYVPLFEAPTAEELALFDQPAEVNRAAGSPDR
ncbi:AAA family ATPase [Dactylosporangium sp. NPDC049742]|uniref:AAA family ATPase n=1 Tax=Dactylosporangium sp. NPDC049742 TaxID=3154737 RepID=UPI00341B79A4